ncbi:hypothetical protein [Rhizobium sp. FY34]|uniref:hypothetical protein n=1 Tax=Rhizobium sp. FY34 TaxID=2562309 RepID=UPI0010BF9817|nr:hypothetical protein [Rhizobium sp. FY34]
MTGNVVKLVATGLEYPADRVHTFIALAKALDVLTPKDAWPGDLWEVGASFVTKGQNRDSRVLAFYNLGSTVTNRQEVVSGAPLADGIKEFAKAYIRYLHSSAPVVFENTVKRLYALQFIEAAFRSLRTEPVIENLNVFVLNTAVAMARDGVGAGRHYQFAIYIQQVHRFCMERRFLNAPFQWKHGIKKPKDKTEVLGQEAKAWRDEKLPSPEAYHALAHVFRNADTFVDRLFSSICAICVSIPIRAHEVLQLRLDCEVYEKARNPETGEMVEAYGIRVYPGKGNPPQVKWVPSVMASIVQQAVERLRSLCGEPRAVAAWYEAYSDGIWLPEAFSHLRGLEWIAKSDLMALNGLSRRTAANQYVRDQRLRWRTVTSRRGNIDEISFQDLEKNIRGLLPRDFPQFNSARDQLYSETLILLPYNGAHRNRATFPCMIEACTVPKFQGWLTGLDGVPSVFDRWGFTERNGKPIRVTTHSFRHWLNTVAQLKGLSDLDIAKWSGRKVEQNQAYNHVSSDEVLSQIREALDDGSGIGPMFEAAKGTGVNRPVDRREFADAQIGAALVTELGICVHDYSLLPCQTHGDCLGCSENVFVKGDLKHKERVAKRLALNEKQLADAVEAIGNDYYGADKWVQAHEISIEKLRRMLAIHDDPSIPDGTIVNLDGGSQDNEVAMALRDRQEVKEHRPRRNDAPSDEDAEADGILAAMWED